MRPRRAQVNAGAVGAAGYARYGARPVRSRRSPAAVMWSAWTGVQRVCVQVSPSSRRTRRSRSICSRTDR